MQAIKQVHKQANNHINEYHILVTKLNWYAMKN